MITPELFKKGEQLFSAALAMEETWNEVDSLVEILDGMLTNALAGDGNKFSRLTRVGVAADMPDQTRWSYAYNFEGYKKKRFVSRICGQRLAPVVFPVRDTERVR
jgi:hypothetical protein